MKNDSQTMKVVIFILFFDSFDIKYTILFSTRVVV